MDEPLSNLDAKLRVQMRADIAKLQRDLGTTTIYVTHDQVEAMTMGDRVAVMSQGVLQQVDTPQRLYDQPGEPLRRRLHRHAADEPARGDVARARTARSRVDVGEQRPGARRRDAAALPGRPRRAGRRGRARHPAPATCTRAAAGPSCRRSPRGSSSSRRSARSRSRTSASTRMPCAAGAGGVEEAVEEEGDAEGVTATRPNLVASFAAARGARARLDDDGAGRRSTWRSVHLFDAETGAPLR